jgi:hypothetical protein
LFDAYLVPKPLPQQLLLFGRSGDELEVLTFGVEQFLVLSVPCGRSGGPGGRSTGTVFVACSLCSCSASLSIRCDFEFWLGELSDGPRVLGGQSAGACGQSACSPRTVRYSGSLLEVLFAFSDSPRLRAGRFAVRVRTVCGSRPDSPRGLCGQSAPSGQTVRQSLAVLFVGSIPPSFFRASVCASRNRY